MVPVEFARQSLDGRITLVMVETARPVQSWWVLMDADDISTASAHLAKREGIHEKNMLRDVGGWSKGMPDPLLLPGLSEWAAAHNLLHVVWTALPAKFRGEKKTPTAEAVVQYLRELDGDKRVEAEHYIRYAPRQICTEYREKIEVELQWTSKEPPLRP
jgi:hypothetical protein